MLSHCPFRNILVKRNGEKHNKFFKKYERLYKEDKKEEQKETLNSIDDKNELLFGTQGNGKRILTNMQFFTWFINGMSFYDEHVNVKVFPDADKVSPGL